MSVTANNNIVAITDNIEFLVENTNVSIIVDNKILGTIDGTTLSYIDNVVTGDLSVRGSYTPTPNNMFMVSDTTDIQEVRKHSYKIWSREGLSRNKGITIEDVLYLDLPNSIGDWNWDALSKHIDISDIRRNPHLSWNNEIISQR